MWGERGIDKIVRLSVRRENIGGRDLTNITHRTTNLIAAEKWTMKLPILMSPRRDTLPLTYLIFRLFFIFSGIFLWVGVDS